MLNRWLQAPGVTSQEPETILRQILVQPLVLQQCIHFPEVAQLAADSLALCFRDLSHQLILPAHPVLGHVLVAPCKLKQVGAPSAPEKPPSSEVAVTKGSSLPPVTTRVRTHAADLHPHILGCCVQLALLTLIAPASTLPGAQCACKQGPYIVITH